jgi:hypothetical protein
MKIRTLSKLFSFLVFTLFGKTVLAAPSDTLNILFIGNSYTHMNVMPVMFRKICKAKGRIVHVEMNTRSGASFSEHTQRPDMYESFQKQKWDYVILQGFSRELSFTPQYLDSATVPYVSQIIDSVKKYSPCANVLFYMTWGYKEGFLEREEIDSYDKMTQCISNGYCYIGNKFDIPIVPVGEVWRKVANKHKKISLYHNDLAHPSKYGSYLAACTFYTAIFKESSLGAYTKTISAEVAKTIQTEASDYVLKNLATYKLDNNYYEIKKETPKPGKYKVACYANYPNATSITWYFNDGESSNEPLVEHTFKYPGKHKVNLKVKDECGEHMYTKNLQYAAPPKPKKKSKN